MIAIPMRIAVSSTLAAAAAFGTGCLVHVTESSSRGGEITYASSLNKAYDIAATFPDSAGSDPELRGTWRGAGAWEDIGATREMFVFEIRQSEGPRSTYHLQAEELEGLPIDEDATDVRFVIRRSAGVFAFEGTRKSKDSRSASGEVTFTADTAYSGHVQSITGNAPTVGQSLWLALQGVSGEFVRELSDAGFRCPIEDLPRLRNHGVSAETVASFKRADGTIPDADEIIRYRNHGVSGTFVSEVRAVKPDITPDEVIRLRNHGVSTEYFRNLAQSGLTADPAVAIKLRNSGVPADYIGELRACGYTVSVEDVIRLRNNGVSSEFICATVQPGYAQLPVNEIIGLRNRGVSAETVRKLRAKE